METFLVKAVWGATSKTLHIQARSAEEALAKAERSRDAKGCAYVRLAGEKGDAAEEE